MSEQDPSEWWDAFVDAFAQASAEAGIGAVRQVGAISVTGQQHGMVALDGRGAVVRRAKLWNDTESSADAQWLLKQLPGGAQEWAERIGYVPLAAHTVSKLSWLHRKEPDHWGTMCHIVLPHDWMTYRLTGRLVTDRGDASGTGYWSPHTGGYDQGILSVIDRERDWTDALPEVLGPTTEAGRWGELAVGPGTGDNMAAALALGVEPGDLVVSIGTSGVVSTVTDTVIADPSGAVCNFADASGRFLPLVCTANAAKVFDTFAALLGVDLATFDAMAATQQAGADGLVLVPYLDGERTPNLPTAHGVLSGLHSNVRREQVARAAVDAVACSLLDAADRLLVQRPEVCRVRVVGGAAQSGALVQALADLSGWELVVPEAAELAAIGAAVQAASVLTGEPLLDIARRWDAARGPTVSPRPGVDASGVRQAYAAAVATAFPLLGR